MSSAPKKIIPDTGFIERLTEACGTAEPARIQRLLNISYQAAKNYIEGRRYPNTEVLLIIAERTGCSIHWLLTGEGNRSVRLEVPENTPLPADHAEAFVRRICVEVINEKFGVQSEPKVVVLPPGSLREEMVSDEPTHSERLTRPKTSPEYKR